MSMTAIITIALVITALSIMVAGFCFYLRDKTLEEIREEVYQKFLEAERNEVLDTGKMKMKWVLAHARLLLPDWAQILITDAFLEKVVQGWFDAAKDLLDDGELNNSTTEGE